MKITLKTCFAWGWMFLIFCCSGDELSEGVKAINDGHLRKARSLFEQIAEKEHCLRRIALSRINIWEQFYFGLGPQIIWRRLIRQREFFPKRSKAAALPICEPSTATCSIRIPAIHIIGRHSRCSEISGKDDFQNRSRA